ATSVKVAVSRWMQPAAAADACWTRHRSIVTVFGVAIRPPLAAVDPFSIVMSRMVRGAMPGVGPWLKKTRSELFPLTTVALVPAPAIVIALVTGREPRRS